MKHLWIFPVVLISAWLGSASVWAEEGEEVDVAGSKDHPALTRIPGYFIDQYEVSDFDSHNFILPNGGEKTVEGKKYVINYKQKTGTKKLSILQVLRNYSNAIKKAGGTILNENKEEGELTGKLDKGKSTLWIGVTALDDGWQYTINVIEPKVMEQEVTVDAKSLGDSIASTGKVAVYGIYFDTGKSVVKPESDPVINEIAKMLQNQKSLKVVVVGHTDNQGSFDSNMKLSKDRADAVVKVLTTKHKIAAARLKAAGVASLSPVASNKDEKGRAQNRRVELVEQ